MNSKFMGLLGAAGGAAVGLAGGAISQGADYRNSKRLMKLQNQYSRSNSRFNLQMQKNLFDATGADKQVKQLDRAGLSRGLMYKGSGAGGATGITEGSSPKGGSSNFSMMGNGMGAGLQAAMTESQIEVNKAQANKLNTDASSVKGSEGTIGESQIKKLVAETKNEGTKNDIMEFESTMKSIETRYKGDEQAWMITKLEYEARDTMKKYEVTEGSSEEQIQIIQNEAVSSALDAMLKQSNIDLTEERKREIYHSILQKWVSQGMKGLDILIKGRLGDIGKGMKGGKK